MASFILSSVGRCGVTSPDCDASCSYVVPSRAHARLMNSHSTRKRDIRVCTAQPTFSVKGLPLNLRDPFTPQRSGFGQNCFDVVGLGQAMVDFSGIVDQEYLASKQLQKGGRRVITVQERAEFIEELKAEGFELNAGGSLANTLAGCANLGRAAHAASGAPAAALRIGMAGCIGDDHLGEFFRTQFANAGVEWISDAPAGTGTGTVIVLTTDDAQRSFLSYPGTSDELRICAATEDAIRTSRILVIEGYLWEFPNAAAGIADAIRVARDAGTLVAMTMADASVVTRHRAGMLSALKAGADILFTNTSEALELMTDPHTGKRPATAEEVALQLGCICPVAVVTDGSKGSYISALGQLHMIPPHWSRHMPVDTCGAGDAYAAGFLYGYLRGYNVRQMGEFAAHAASCVISHRGPQMLPEHADALVGSHPRRESSLPGVPELFAVEGVMAA